MCHPPRTTGGTSHPPRRRGSDVHKASHRVSSPIDAVRRVHGISHRFRVKRAEALRTSLVPRVTTPTEATFTLSAAPRWELIPLALSTALQLLDYKILTACGLVHRAGRELSSWQNA